MAMRMKREAFRPTIKIDERQFSEHALRFVRAFLRTVECGEEIGNRLKSHLLDRYCQLNSVRLKLNTDARSI
jgi:hypothetical protein